MQTKTITKQTKTKNVPTQVHTRKLDRMVARENMKKLGIVHINKNNFFANNWRNYITI